MSKYLLLGAVIAVVAVGTYASGGCDGASARVGVAKDKVIKEIDKVLGELKVKRKEVQIAYDRISDASGNLREKRIEAQILMKRFNKDIEELQEEQSANKRNLKKLKPLLAESESSGEVERNGKTITAAELTKLAENTMKKMERTETKLVHKKKMKGVFEKNLATLSANEETSKTQLAQLRDDLEEIDSKQEMLDSMKTDASLVSGQGTSINDEFEKLSEQVGELMTKVDTQVAIEEAKLEDRMDDITAAPADIDELFADDSNVSETMSKLDKWLDEGE